jgi:hypothetical protein
MVADPPDGDSSRAGRLAPGAAAGAVAAIDPVLLAALDHRVLGDDRAEVEDPDHIRQLLDLDHPPSPVGHAVIIAADRDEPVMADPPLELEHGVEPMVRQGLQLGLLGSKGLRDHLLSGAMDAHIGDRVEPLDQLRVLQVGPSTPPPRNAEMAGMSTKPILPGLAPAKWAGRISQPGNFQSPLLRRITRPLTLAKAGEDKARVMGELRTIAGSAWTRADQKNRQLWFGLGGVAVGILAWAILPGLVAREVVPASWHWPERMAARTLGTSMWDGARRLAGVSQPEA